MLYNKIYCTSVWAMLFNLEHMSKSLLLPDMNELEYSPLPKFLWRVPHSSHNNEILHVPGLLLFSCVLDKHTCPFICSGVATRCFGRQGLEK